MEALISSLVPTLPIFFLVFIAIYLLSYFYIFRDWVGALRLEVSSCLMSLSHGTPVTVVATFSILETPFFDFAAPNTTVQSMILEYSIAFFSTDLLHYMLFVPADIIYKAHHLAVLYVFITCRCIVGHGAQPLLILLILAEVTSACRNAWRFFRLRPAESPAAAAVVGWCSPVFYSFYSVVRGVLGPLVVYKMGVFYASEVAEGVIPKWAWISWMVVIGSAIVGSMLWILSRWMDFYREKCRRKEMSLS